jgi:hypothetical protein
MHPFPTHSPRAHPIQYHKVILNLPLALAHAIHAPALLAPLVRTIIPQISALLEPVPLTGPVHGIPDIRARECEPKEDKLHEEPRPSAAGAAAAGAAAALARRGARLLSLLAVGCRLRRCATGVLLVQVMRSNGDDVVVVGEFARLGAEAEVCDGRDFEVWDFEARGPFVFGLVLQLELEVLVLEVGEFRFGRGLRVADAAGLHIVSAGVMSGVW